MLESGADVNDEDATCHVAEFDDHGCIRVLLENGLDADRSATVLLRKLDFDDFEGVKLILDLGCDVNHKGNWKKSPLHQAIIRGRDLKTIELLIDRGADVDATQYDGATPWFLACAHGRNGVAKFLVQHGANTELGTSEQFLAVCGMGQDERARELLAANPDMFARLSDQHKALIVSAGRTGNQQGLASMLDVGFDISAQDQQGFTALHWAAWYGHLECVKFLIDRGASLAAKNNYGGTVIDSTVWGYANSNGNDRHSREILELLAEAGADPMTVSPFPSGHAASDHVIEELRNRNGGRH